MKVCAIIPAAGQGTRIGGPVPKQFLRLNGKPILHHTLAVFENCGLVESVILVMPEKDVEAGRAEWLKQPGIVRNVVAGGVKRQDSVYNGFKALDTDTEIVIVHDGVRPFATPQMIRQTVEAASQHGAAITAIPVSDTLKQVTSAGLVERTIDRDGLWRVQTPQAFRYDVLQIAFEKAFAESFYGTDEGALIEYIGKQVKVVAGSELNIKITRPEDLILGSCIASALANDIKK